MRRSLPQEYLLSPSYDEAVTSTGRLIYVLSKSRRNPVHTQNRHICVPIKLQPPSNVHRSFSNVFSSSVAWITVCGSNGRESAPRTMT
jgi:hypothetical protein